MAVGVMIVLVIFWILLGIGGLVGLFFAIRALIRYNARVSRKNPPRKGDRDRMKFDYLKKTRPPPLPKRRGGGGAAASGKFPAGKAYGGQTGPPVFQNAGGPEAYSAGMETQERKSVTRHGALRQFPVPECGRQ